MSAQGFRSREDCLLNKRLFLRYLNYFLNPSYWLTAIRHPKYALGTLWKILTHPQLFKLSQSCEGLIHRNLGFLLYDTILRNASTSPNIVEVGAFTGLSTCYISLAAKQVGKRVKSFELFSGLPIADPILDAGFHEGQFSSDVAEYESNVGAYGYRDIVDLVIGDARQTLLPTIASEGFSVAFLDVDVYEVMKELLFQLWSIARGGEVIVVHDVDSPGVRKAVDEFHDLSCRVVHETIVVYGGTAILTLPSLITRKDKNHDI